MKKSLQRFAIQLVFCIFLAACAVGAKGNNEGSLVEKTPIEVTRIVTQVVESTCVPESKYINDPSPTQSPTFQNDNITIGDGGITIVEYYTLINFKQYKEAFNLLSNNRPNPQNFDNFVSVVGLTKSVKVLKVQPYNDWAIDNGRSIIPGQGTEKRFYVEIIGEGEGGMLGSSVSNSKQQLFVKVILENNEWKIFSADTAPFLN